MRAGEELRGVQSVGAALGALGVKVAVEGVHGSFEDQATIGAGFEVAPDFRLDGRGQTTF